MLESDLSENAVTSLAIPERFSSWEFEVFYPANLRYYYRTLAAKKG
jgi:hypothetical protein